MKLSKIQLAGIIASQYRTMDALSDEIRELIHLTKDMPNNDHEKRLTNMLKHLEEISELTKPPLM